MIRAFAVVLLAVLLAQAASAQEPARVPILVNRPAMVKAQSWPVTFGVPFKPGACREAAHLGIVNGKGNAVACDISKVGDWPDGSLRWAHVAFEPAFAGSYFLVIGQKEFPRPAPKAKVTISRDAGKIIVATGPARYVFAGKAGCFESIGLDVNGDGVFSDDETLVARAGEAFYVIDSRGRRGVLRARKTAVEVAGTRRAVIGVKGEYLTPDGRRNAAGIVYYTFYAGRSLVRISHKFIVTENTNDIWFRDIGMTLPVAAGPKPTAAFNRSHDRLADLWRGPVAPKREIVMLQEDFPHFGSRTSRFLLFEEADGKRRGLASGAACGDWCDLSSADRGLAVQAPAFAEMFPKAFRISPDAVTVKFWASECGRELDFRTKSIVRDYLGHDWVPPGQKIMKLANTAHGTARTHDIWLYPHKDGFSGRIVAELGATREAIYACIDPAWVARSKIFGPLGACDAKRFPRQEAAVSDYFARSVEVGRKVFPQTGYLYYGMYPWGAQPWRPKAEQGNRWYPSLHRLSRHMDYDMRRSVWLLFARSGERRYYDYARRYTRFMHDMIFANTDTPSKPLGWFAEGYWHSPIVWGHFGDGKVPADFKREVYNTDFSLTLASSADMVQFVYDWFLCGDFHSRDMAYNWKNAMIKGMDFDVDKALGLFRPDCFIRMLSAAYELDHDPRLLDYGRRIVRRLIPEKGPAILRPKSESGARINYGKAGEIFAAFYYYWVATGDPLAEEALTRLARFTYRMNRMDRFFSRGSPLMPAFAVAWRNTQEPLFAQYLCRIAADFGRNWTTLAEAGIDKKGLDQNSTGDIGRMSMVGQAPINVGIPVALAVAAEYKGTRPYLPVALKLRPTQRTHVLLKKDAAGAARLDVYVNNWGHTQYAPRLLDPNGKAMPLEIVERQFKFVTAPECYDQNSIWVHRYADHFFFRLRIPAVVAPGVYELDLGDEVDYTLLHSEIDKVVQVAPDGLIIERGRRYFFPLPANATAIEFFAHRPVQLYDPAGKPAPAEDLKKGHFRAAVEGKRGAWSVETLDDQYTTGAAATDTFFNLEKAAFADGERFVPLMVALGTPTRLFDVDTTRFRPAAKRMPTIGVFDPKAPFTPQSADKVFGQALHVRRHFVDLPMSGAPRPDAANAAGAPGQLPRERGTVEFWFRPRWSATDCAMATPHYSTHRTQFYKGDPIRISYFVDPDNSGRTGRYNLVRLMAQVMGVGATQANVFLETGKWYHMAVTWDIDGKDNKANIFINGRLKAFSLYKPLMKSDTPVDKLAPPDAAVRLGVGDWYGHMFTAGLFDELRISQTVRYTGNYDVPRRPFESDADTCVLMHFDGDLRAEVNGKASEAALKAGRLW